MKECVTTAPSTAFLTFHRYNAQSIALFGTYPNLHFRAANIVRVVDEFARRLRNPVVFKHWTKFINKISLDNFLLQPCCEISCQTVHLNNFLCMLLDGLSQKLNVRNGLGKIFLHDPCRVVKTFGRSRAPGQILKVKEIHQDFCCGY